MKFDNNSDIIQLTPKWEGDRFDNGRPTTDFRIQDHTQISERDIVSLSGGETLVYAYVQLNSSPSGSETIIFAPADGSSIFDQAGNPMHPSSITGAMTFNASAAIDSLFLDQNNEYLDIIFSNGIYSDPQQLQTIQLNDFQISMNSNGGNASVVNISNLVNNSGNSLSGVENIIRFI